MTLQRRRGSIVASSTARRASAEAPERVRCLAAAQIVCAAAVFIQQLKIKLTYVTPETLSTHRVVQPGDQTGVYLIYCASNKKGYIGHSLRVWERICTHLSHLRTKIHCNRYLQNTFDKYGQSSLSFHMLEDLAETLSESELVDRENHWLLQVPRSLVLNLSIPATVGGTKLSGEAEERRKATLVQTLSRPEVRQKKADAARAAWQRPDVRVRNSAALTAKNRTAEYREKMRKRHQEMWADPTFKAQRVHQLRRSAESYAAQGSRMSGERHPRAKLTQEIVLAIRQEYDTARQAGAKIGLLYRRLAAQYSISAGTVKAVALRKCWTSIKAPES